MSTAAQPGSADRRGWTGPERKGNVDLLRALAALAVLVGHSYVLGGRSLPVKAQYWYDLPLITLTTGVWLFFGISGYVITKPFVDRLLDGRPLPDLVAYALRRGLRIFPLYWVALTAVIVIDGAGNTAPWQFPVHYLLLHNLVPGREEALFSVAWTLTLEFLFYIAVPILAVGLARRARGLSAERLALLVSASWVASIAFTVLADLAGAGQTGLWLRGSLPAMWQMFCPGILLAIAPHLQRRAWRRWLVELPAQRRTVPFGLGVLIAGALLGAAAPLRFGIVTYQVLVDASRPLFAVGYGLLIAAAIRGRERAPHGSWLLKLGLVSYGIYLLHAVVLTFLISDPGRSLVPLPHSGPVAFVVHIAFLAAVTIVLALASWRWFEQPLIQLGRAVGDRRPASTGGVARSAATVGLARTHAEAGPTRRTKDQ